MTDPVSFTSTTPRHALPFLFAGQAQKEFFVNESLARLDLLLHPAVEGERADPPGTPVKGECWLVGAGATGPWAAHERAVAGWDGTAWTFAEPVADMMVRDREAGGFRRFSGEWQAIARPADPAGGTAIDTEARAAIVAIMAALETFGIFSNA